MSGEKSREPSRAAAALLTRMRRSAVGWSSADFQRLYLGCGFVMRERGDHTVYYHPRHAWLRASVPRHRELRAWVAREAVALIEELLRLQEAEHEQGH